MTTYAVHATVTTHIGDYSGSRAVPTFYLDSRVQGIVSADHAVRVAQEVLNPLGRIAVEDLNISAYPVNPAREDADLEAFARPSDRR